MAQCERKGCKKPVKRKIGSGRPPKFCSPRCARADWRSKHKIVYVEAQSEAAS